MVSLPVGSHAHQDGADGLHTRTNRVRSTAVLQPGRLITGLEVMILSADPTYVTKPKYLPTYAGEFDLLIYP